MSEYDVGYGKPPKKHEFQKGKSGNPRGRPRTKQDTGLPEVTTILTKPIQIRHQGREVEMRPNEVMYRNMINKAITEHHRPSIKKLINLLIKHNIIPKAPQQQRYGVMQLSRSEMEEFDKTGQLPYREERTT